MKFTLVDHAAGNVASVERALQRLGAEFLRADAPDAIANAEAIILPGVGHFSALVRALDQQNLRAALVDALRRGIPFLGICLGLQALFEFSEEAPQLRGLHVLPGSVCALPTTVKLPHMGWNQLESKRESRLLAGVGQHVYFYFAHSFAAGAESSATVATCTHGASFAAVLEQKNIHAVQFHPEKSGESGARVLRNFLEIAARG